MGIEWLLLILALVVLIFYAVYSSMVVVHQSEQQVVERLGRYHRTLTPGFHFLVPLIDKIVGRVNMRESMLDIDRSDVITKDNATVTVDAVAFYQILNPKDATYSVDDLRESLRILTMTTMRTVIGSMPMDSVLSNREEINSSLLDTLDKASKPWGAKVTRVEISELNPPHDIQQAMSRQLMAEREGRAKIHAADASKTAARLEAEARERTGQAEAEATRMLSEALKDGDVNAVNYFIAQKYVEALKDIGSATNSKVVMMPVEAGGVIGSLAGLAELTKSAGTTKNNGG